MSRASDDLKFQPIGIGSALANNSFVVPMNQRDYAWGPEHIDDLLGDLARVIKDDAGNYFLGTIVLTKGDGDSLEVADGQQRLATTTVLLAAIRDYLIAIDQEPRARAIEKFLSNADYDTERDIPKLRLNVDDDEFFRTFVIPRPNAAERIAAKPDRDSHKRLMVAAEKAASHIKSIASIYSKPADKADALKKWLDFLTNRAMVILLTAPDHLNAFVMFETLNDRGLKAGEADLLKNYLLSQAGDERMAEARQKWAKMVGVLESISEKEIVMSYFRHSLMTQYGPTKEREIYERVEKDIRGSNKAIAFVKTLSVNSITYAATFNPTHAKWNEYDESARLSLETIIELGVEQIRPLIFAVALKFEPPEAAKAFRLLVAWSVRFLVVGGRGGLLDRHYAIVSQDIGGGKIKTAKQLATSGKPFVPDDAAFEASFTIATVSQGYLARYYLRAMEYLGKEYATPDLEPVKDKAVLNLEHVLPENPEDNWPHIQPETAAAYYRRIGNMVLLNAGKNSDLGNQSFDVKRPILKTSGLALTKEVARCKEPWGPKHIQERQKRLAALAVRTWPITVA
jgi:hypothetical protein